MRGSLFGSVTLDVALTSCTGLTGGKASIGVVCFGPEGGKTDTSWNCSGHIPELYLEVPRNLPGFYWTSPGPLRPSIIVWGPDNEDRGGPDRDFAGSGDV